MLFKKLRETFPGLRMEERRRWDVLTLSLGLPYVGEITEERNKEGWESALQLARQKIADNGMIRNPYGEVARHFGFETLEGKNYVFGELIKRWQENSTQYPEKWIDGLYEEMTRAILNIEALPAWYLMKSDRAGVDWWLVPIVNHVRVLPDEESIEFDLYFYRIPVDEKGHANIGVQITND